MNEEAIEMTTLLPRDQSNEKTTPLSTVSRDHLGAWDFRRKLINRLFMTLLVLASLLAIVPLLSVFMYVLQQGLPALNLSFFTHLPAPVGELGGGMGNAVAGTLILVGLASLLGIPIGIACGIYLSEYGNRPQGGKLAATLRFTIDLLASVPSIIIGLFAYAVLVVPMRRFSGYAGGAALAVIMIPTIARSTEELLKMVPTHIREAGLALGIPRWKVILRIVLRGSMSGITTGVMLSVARAAGETAPLLFTSLNSRFWPSGLDQPISSLPVQIYTYAISPYEEWHRQAWAGALLLVSFVFLFNLLTRLALGRPTRSRD
jgi:phosphate transport system permease protein